MIKPLGKGLSLLLFVAATLTSCKKDKDESKAITKENLVGTYTLVQVNEKFGEEQEVNTTNDWLDECEKDDEITLNANMTFTHSDKGTVCDPEGGGTGSWAFDETKKSIEIDGGIGGVVETFTSSEMVLKESYNQGGFSFSRRWTFKRK